MNTFVASALTGLASLSLLAPACGGATAPTMTGKYDASLAYSRCMRSHGVLNFPDPKQVAGGIQVSGSAAGINPQSPLFISAQQSCRHLLPGGGQPPTRPEQQQALARMLHISHCMRAHGVSWFPDPTLSPPSSRAGYSEIRSNGIVWLAIPDSIDVRSPAFEQAAATCNLE